MKLLIEKETFKQHDRKEIDLETHKRGVIFFEKTKFLGIFPIQKSLLNFEVIKKIQRM